MPDFPPGYDPIQADYAGGSYVSPGDQAIGGMIGLAAFGMIGVGAFFAYEAAVIGPEALVGTTISFTPQGISVGGTALFVNSAEVALSGAQMVELSAMASGNLAFSEGAVMAILESWGLELMSLEGLVLLSAYNVGPNVPFGGSNYGNYGQYLGNFVPGGHWSGFAGDPGFPGFPGGGFPPNNPSGLPGHGYWACVIIDDHADCHFTY